MLTSLTPGPSSIKDFKMSTLHPTPPTTGKDGSLQTETRKRRYKKFPRLQCSNYADYLCDRILFLCFREVSEFKGVWVFRGAVVKVHIPVRRHRRSLVSPRVYGYCGTDLTRTGETRVSGDSNLGRVDDTCEPDTRRMRVHNSMTILGADTQITC